jgi:hypothetical protein
MRIDARPSFQQRRVLIAPMSGSPALSEDLDDDRGQVVVRDVGLAIVEHRIK